MVTFLGHKIFRPGSNYFQHEMSNNQGPPEEVEHIPHITLLGGENSPLLVIDKDCRQLFLLVIARF